MSSNSFHQTEEPKLTSPAPVTVNKSVFDLLHSTELDIIVMLTLSNWNASITRVPIISYSSFSVEPLLFYSNITVVKVYPELRV